jgi:prolyl-tRNA synthetase
LAIPVLCGQKTEKEKFAGAVATYGMEAMMKDGKSLQAGTSHFLGQNFSKAFDIQYLDKDGTHKYVYTTSWGVSTRLIGALIMAHGDQRGLIIPPVVAPTQVVIIPIAAKKAGVMEACKALQEKLQAHNIRVELDDTDNSPGWKFNEWEMKGVPLRIELGPRDLENGEVAVFRRDTLEKAQYQLNGIEGVVEELLKTVQKDMLEAARKRRDERIVHADTLEGILDGVEKGNFVKAGWCGCRECEDEIKAKTAASARIIVEGETAKTCAVCGKKAKNVVIFARAY